MLQYLVERLPLMITPKWVLTKSQPIALDDVITYLVKSIESNDTELGQRYEAIDSPLTFTVFDILNTKMSRGS
jgi:uncharacterized protein YbjT (DUF2867 family)